ncbi:MAG: STAS domain-containing protein [Candidatus Acidiferrales bacterium]
MSRKEWENVEIRRRDAGPGVVVMELSGSVRMGPDCRKIDQHVDEMLGRNELRLVIDLANVTHIDSSMVGTIVRTHSRLSKAGGALRLAGAKGMVRDVLEMTQVTQVIKSLGTVAEAEASL